MKTIIINYEDASNSCTVYNWMQENEIDDVLDFFEGDPDILKVNGDETLFVDFKINENERFVIYLDIEYKTSKEVIKKRLTEFFSDEYKTYYEDSENIPVNMAQMHNGVCYRGGKGYIYNLWYYKLNA